MRQGPLAGRWAAAAAMVMFALVPYLVLSAAVEPLTLRIATDLHTSLQTLSLGPAWRTRRTPSARCWQCSLLSICRSAG